MIVTYSIIALVLVLYCITLLGFASAFSKQPFSIGDLHNDLPVTIIICARNEEKNIGICLNGIIAQDYPKNLVQVIVVNDASTDNTAMVAQQLLQNDGIEYRLITNPIRSGKKRSITAAIKLARHELIILRDADTFTPSNLWLKSLVSSYQTRPGLMVGPVAIAAAKGPVDSLQTTEALVLTLVTAGSAYSGKPFLCSSANLVFTKDIFVRTGGYSSNLYLASGDDIFLLEETKKLDDVKISFVKNQKAVVYTYPVQGISKLLVQRARWASKFRPNTNFLNRWVAAIVLLANICFILSAVLLLQSPSNPLLYIYIFLKSCTDIFLLWLASDLIKPLPPVNNIATAVLLYPFYALAVAFASFFIKPEWKA